MALRISIGQYYPAQSPIHRLDPRVKVVCGLALMISVFFIRSLPQLALGYVAMFALMALSRIPAREVLGSIKSIVIVLAVLSVFNMFAIKSGQTLVWLGPLSITTGGLWGAFLYTLRLVVAIVICALMLLTTTPTELTDAADALLSPLSRIGLPGHEIAMIFSLMLRFIPTLGDEASAILDAQASRGGALGEGSLAHRVKAIIPVIVALLASSMRHANGLARALDARCYEGGAARSHWHPLKLHAGDGIALVITVIYVVVLISLG